MKMPLNSKPSTLPTIGDARSRELAEHLRNRSRDVREPQRSRIVHMLQKTLFISHTSVDDAVIKGTDAGSPMAKPGSIYWICADRFKDPFYHSLKTGGADAYERIVGLALLASTRVLVMWSENALQSDYVRAEVLVATEDKKRIAAYLLTATQNFPIAGVTLIQDLDGLRNFLDEW